MRANRWYARMDQRRKEEIGIMNIESLKADALNIMNALNECWSEAAAITHTADTLLRIHPAISREDAIVAAEQARWGSWP